MSVFEFLSSLNSLNIKVWIEDGQLRYRAPKGVMTSALKQELIERKAEILSCLQEAKTAKKLAFEPILPVDRDCDLPLSFSQQRMWFLNQIDSQNPSYNESFQFQISGALNVTVLEQSINEIIRRHEALRTIFPTVDGLAVQQIVPTLTINIPVVDLQGLEETEIQQRVTQEVRQPFDLAKQPLLRASVLRLESELHLLILTLHHIIVDGWSIGILIKELSAIYQAFSTGSPTSLPELTIQYADFAVWQRKWLTEELQQQQLDYWKQQLADAPPLLELPTDYPRASVQNFSGAVQEWKLNSHLTTQIKTLSQQSGTTLFVTLLSAFAILLHRYSGQDDICIGSPFANRNYTEVESLIGCFINTLVLRTQIKDNPSFQELLAQVNSVVLDAQANQNVPFERVVEALQPERSLSYNPLFQVMFVLENFSLETLELPGISLTPEIVERGTAQFDLSLSIWETQNELIGSWEYDRDLFEADTIARMTGHFQTLLEAIVSDRNRKIGELPLLTSSEQHQLLVQWNDTQADYPLDKGIHQLFEEQVARTPDAVAVVYENQQLTYQELNSRANQLAHYLRSLGVGADVLVGLCVERSLLMVIGLLGILKAGGAYVPLDPEYPTERLSFMVEDAQVKVLLTQQALLEKLANNERQFICLDTDWQIISQWSDQNLVNTTISENLAYVIYTSGSTGKPKGVMIEHRSFVNLIAATKLIFAINSSDRVLQFSSISFDSAIEEICHCLICGGTLVLRTDEMLNSVSTFLQKCQEWKLTVLELPTAYWHQLTSELTITNEVLPTSVRLVVIGGEQVLLEKLKLWQKYVDDQLLCGKLEQPPLLLNGYGPSEATVGVTLCKLSELVLEDIQTRLPIGRPINNVQIYILDSYLQPMPIGMAGELYIGGICLARGYWNARELTAEKFISNPFSADPNSRLYKTGDLARYLPDGNIEYLGRIDNQVKIRGFRIELGEIEAILSQHPQIQTSVVIARVDNSREKRLVAYLVSDSEVPPTTNELREYLKAKLPEYMVPSAIVFLDTLPLTPNGKIDRRALATLLLDNIPTENYVAPRTPIEEILCHLFSQVIKLNQVGINNNFFEIGGHSLLATQLISRIRTHLQIELPLKTLFSVPTVAELSAHIQQLQQQNLKLNCPPIVKRENQNELPLSYAQTRLWFIDQLQPNSALYNIPSALRIAGRLPIATLEKSLREIVRRHEVLRTNFITINGQANQIINPENNGFLSLIDLQHLGTAEQEITVQELIQQQTIQPFDLANDSLIRITLIKLSETEHILIICMHHIISDGWSIGVFVQELAALYNADIQGQTDPLTPLPIQYADFAIWQREWLQGEVLETQLNYWKQQLADAPALLSLPTDRPRPAVQTYTGAHQKFALSSELTEKLTQLSQEQGVTLFMTLLAGFNTLLYRYTQQEDIVVGSPIANRNHSEIEGLIGFFVNTLVLRTDLSENPSFTELVHRVKEVSLAAYAHQDLPFEMLVEAVAPLRDLSYSPLFQVMFVLQNAPISELELSGLTLSPQELEMPIAKFDLTLSMENTATGLEGVWEYNTDLFDGSTIERMTGHFLTLLEAIVVEPQTPISQLPILTAPEQQQLLVEWNDTQTDYPTDKCIHQLFEEQVEKTPDAVAVVFEHQQLTYRELNNRANQLAHYLRSLGVGADVLVGICVERSLEMIVGLLGILKAGGAYLPLDPDYPQERLRFILEDAGISLLLTQSFLLEQLSKIEPKQNFQILCLDELTFSEELTGNPQRQTTAVHLAYVIYTSGSTGKPKGVMIEHRAIVNLSWIWAQTFQVQQQSRLLQFGSFSFDLSVAEIATSLVSGASLYLADKQTLLPSQILVDFLVEHQITHSFLSPSALSVLPQADLPDLQCLTVGGETCSAQLVTQWGQARSFYNCYGPTESTVTAAIALMHPNGETPSIGKPVSNLRIYILDKKNQPLPLGVPGELCIAGVGLARGYLNRPDLTAQKFVEVNLCGQIERIYKTGDLARYLPDGNIEYLGRIDNQVKIRGFRIELGEIEAILSQHPQIQTSVVIAREDNPQEKRLVAYLVSNSEVTPTTNQVREYLKAKLPEYMVPSAIVFLETLPLTPNGKVDRRTLPKPESRSGIENSLVLPRTPVEETLAQIWKQVLQIEQIGIHDNYFELGGDSILSIQIISRAKKAGLELTVKQLFSHQTIAELASVAGTSKTTQIPQGIVTGKVELTPIQQWFFEQKPAEPHHFNQSWILTTPPDFQPQHLKPIWEELLKHHDALRLRFTQTESGWQQIYAVPSQDITIHEIDLSTVAEPELSAEIENQANSLQASLNLTENLVQVAYFKLGESQPGRLLIIIHHLVIDGVSWRILLEDFQTAYQQISQGFRERQPNGQSIQLPAKTTSFQDWAKHLKQYAQSEKLKSELTYCLKESDTLFAPIPVDYPGGENTVASAENICVSLNEAETTALLQEVPVAYKTQINDILLTALVLVLQRWTNTNSVLFNLEGHGREDISDQVDLSRTVGWFTTIFPVIISLKTTENLGEVIKSVKEQLRAIPDKGIGYGVLRYLCDDPEIKNQLETRKTAEISFNYLGQFSQVINQSSLLQLATESSGNCHSSQGQRSSILDINAIITNASLQINWTYSNHLHNQETIEHIAQEFLTTLREIIAHCLIPENGGYTSSDFPLIKLNQLELEQVLARVAFTSEQGKTINWRNIEDIYPLSPMQKGMLFESLSAPESGVYFEQMICTLTGNLDIPAFEQAWQKLVATHSIFRTAFVWESLEQPVQVVFRQVEVKIQTHDWRHLPAQQQEQNLAAFLSVQRQQGFDVSVAPLLSLHLMQSDDNTYQFVFSFHHVLLDGWSFPLVFQYLWNCYYAIVQGTTFDAQPSLNYRHYIAWLQQQNVEQAQAFWRKKLQGFTAPTPLMVDKLLSNRENNRVDYQEQEIHLSVAATRKAHTFVREHQLTLNNLVQATWALLLSRYSQESDVVFGATVSGRPASIAGVESMVGLFINTLPMRVQLSSQTEILDLLQDLQAQLVESEQFSYSSLVEIQGLSDVPRGTSLFDSILVFENYPVDSNLLTDQGSLSFSNIQAVEQTNYPLTLVVAPGEQLLLKISYDTNRFEYDSISRMLGHFQTLLEAVVENPSQPISQLPILTASEQQQLLVEWNDTQTDYPVDKCIHQLFEEQVEKTPDAVAVVFEHQQLTYRELNNRANQLAHYLRSLGVGADILVGICVERSLEMIVGLLGILKAGGAYLPLDPEYPQDRLQFMLADAQVSVILTQQSVQDKIPTTQAKIICLDETKIQISQNPQNNPNSEVSPSHLANLIYTSGSTGKPKGVMVEHRGLCNLAIAQIQAFTLSSHSRVLQFASFSFDASIWEIIMAFGCGATLYLGSKDSLMPGQPLIERLRDDGITHVTLPQSALAVLPVEELPTLQTIIVAGEACPAELIQQWSVGRNFFNAYGPTEASVCATIAQCRDGDGISIGRPIANTQVYILDRNLQPVPIGVPGELHIGGVGLAIGYLNRPELTQEKFITNPFDNSERLYKTGDLARYLPDGNIEYLGRIDNQVKIRGFRIELGEIEAVLSQHPQIQTSVVIAREDNPQEKRLVAYLVSDSDIKPTTNELRKYLKAKLPEYMIPSAIVFLETLPLTPNGKIDRRALPKPELDSTILEKYVAPRNPLELQLVQIWSKILKVPQVGVQDNFFDLGGHSLLVPYLIAQIKQQFGKDLPLITLFQNPTIEQLASIVQQDSVQNDSSSESVLVAIQPNGSKQPFFCIPGAGAYPFYLYNLASYLDQDQPFYSFQADGLDGKLEPIIEIENIAAQYIQALKAVQSQGPYFLGGHSFGGKVAFEIAQQLLRQGHTVALVAIFDTPAPFNGQKQIVADWDHAKWLSEFAKLMEFEFAKNLGISDDTLKSLLPEEQLKYVLERLKRVNILPADAQPQELNNLLQVLKANALVDYLPQQVYPTPITLFRAQEVSSEELASKFPSEILEDMTWGWNKFSAEQVNVHFVPGDHLTMMAQPHVQVLAERLKACIEKASATIIGTS